MLNNTLKIILINNNNNVTLITTAKNKVIGVQIPSYTSATHIWQGKADILNKKPKIIQSKANFNSKILSKNKQLPKNIWISKKFKEPTQPNKILTPNKNTPVEIAPNEKYLIEASIETIP